MCYCMTGELNHISNELWKGIGSQVYLDTSGLRVEIYFQKNENEMKSVWSEKNSLGMFQSFWNYFQLSLVLIYFLIFNF